jgi:glycerol kinase
LGSAILAGVGCGHFASVKEACKLIETDKSYAPTGADYSEVYQRFKYYDDVLNVKR